MIPGGGSLQIPVRPFTFSLALFLSLAQRLSFFLSVQLLSDLVDRRVLHFRDKDYTAPIQVTTTYVDMCFSAHWKTPLAL